MSVNASQEPVAFREFELSGWQQAVERYHLAWGRLTHQAADLLVDSVDAAVGSCLLDVATGPGYAAAIASDRGSNAVGLDFSPEMIRKAQSLYPSVTFREGDAKTCLSMLRISMQSQ